MIRATRKERQEQTRGRLVETAQDLFLRRGLGATSLDEVAAVAGYSKGAVYSSFATKHELALAVLDRVRETRLRGLLDAVLEAPSADALLVAVQRWADDALGDPGWTALESEVALSTRAAAPERAALAARARGMTTMLADLIEARAAAYGTRLRLEPQRAAALLVSVGIGVGMQRSVDSEASAAVVADALRLLLPADA